MDVELKKLSLDDDVDIYNLLQEIPKNENGFNNSGNGLTYDEYKEWLKKSIKFAEGIELEDGRVPGNIYWLYVNKKPVGIGKLRHRLTDTLRMNGGHIGYAISPSERNKGYGKLLLNNLIYEAKTLGIDKVLITVNNDNPASIKVAVNNGGVIEDVSEERHYIWIDCSTR